MAFFFFFYAASFSSSFSLFISVYSGAPFFYFFEVCVLSSLGVFSVISPVAFVYLGAVCFFCRPLSWFSAFFFPSALYLVFYSPVSSTPAFPSLLLYLSFSFSSFLFFFFFSFHNDGPTQLLYFFSFGALASLHTERKEQPATAATISDKQEEQKEKFVSDQFDR